MTDIAVKASVPEQSDRLASLLTGPILPRLLKLAAPNIVGFFVMSCVAIAEMWYVGQLGTSALAGFAVMFPMVMLMQMLSAGAIGGVIAATTARAIGGGDYTRANRIVWHATILAILASFLFFLLSEAFGRQIAMAIGAKGESLRHALDYSGIVFAGLLPVWLFNIFSSLLRGTGDMKMPALAMVITAVFQISISGALCLGWLGLPVLGIKGIAWGLVIASLIGCIMSFVKLKSGRSGIRFSKKALGIDNQIVRDMFRVGGMAAISPLISVASIVLLTGLVSRFGEAAIAGFGIGTRLEFILVPIVFGLGAAMISMVGTNIGAGQMERAHRIAWVGGGIAAFVCGVVGLIVGIFPQSWAGVFTSDPMVYEAASAYLLIVGPTYFFFGLGLSLYFASQGAHAVFWPVLASVARLVIAVGIGSYAIRDLGAEYTSLLMYIAISLTLYGLATALSIALGAWRRANKLSVVV